jgi:LL-diaminopimelate aminotransferase
MEEIETLISYYLGNSEILRERLTKMGFDVYGGTDAPYVFIGLNGTSSWDMF